MSKIKKLLIINGSYREGGITDQAILTVRNALEGLGVDSEIIQLRDQEIKFCLNCRECMKNAGSTPEACVQHDAMAGIVEKIESADAYVLAVPTNSGSATALFKRFMERLAVYFYWPWGSLAPKYRKAGRPRKKALLITSSAAPGWLARWIYGTSRQLKYTAKIIGAYSIGTLHSGLIAGEVHSTLPASTKRKISSMVEKLLS